MHSTTILLTPSTSTSSSRGGPWIPGPSGPRETVLSKLTITLPDVSLSLKPVCLLWPAAVLIPCLSLSVPHYLQDKTLS